MLAQRLGAMLKKHAVQRCIALSARLRGWQGIAERRGKMLGIRLSLMPLVIWLISTRPPLSMAGLCVALT